LWIQISSGKGPDECALATGMYLIKLIEKLEKRKIVYEVLSIVKGRNRECVKSALISAERHSIDKLGLLEGSMKWISRSPFRPLHKRKNWFFDITFLSEPEENVLNRKDIKIETMKNSGAGGQHVNTTDSAVKAIHIPTKLSAIAREERSQHMNRKLALSRLARLIEERNRSKIEKTASELWTQKQELIRGNAVETFKGKKFRRIF